MSFQVIDKNAIMDDERVQRLKKIKLLERENAEMAPFWAEKQKALFPTAIQLTQTPTIGQIITEETQRNASNPDVLYQRAEQKIKQIADNANTEYILDRLDDLDLKYLVNGWDGIVKQIKEKYSASGGLDKDVFVAIVKENSSNMDMNLSGIDTETMTYRGNLKKEQKERENFFIDEEAKKIRSQEFIDRRKRENLSEKNEARKAKELERQKKLADDALKPIPLSRNAKKHQKYLLRKERNKLSGDEVRNVMNDMLDKVAIDETPESQEVRRVLNDMIGQLEKKERKKGDVQEKPPLLEKDDDLDQLVADDRESNERTPDFEEFIKYKDLAKILKTKYYKDFFEAKKRELNAKIKATPKSIIKDLLEEANNTPLFVQLRSYYPEKSKLDVWKLYQYMAITYDLAESERIVEKTDPEQLQTLENLVIESKKAKKQMKEMQENNQSFTSEKSSPIKQRLNKENKKKLEEDMVDLRAWFESQNDSNIDKAYKLNVNDTDDLSKIRRSKKIERILNAKEKKYKDEMLSKQKSNRRKKQEERFYASIGNEPPPPLPSAEDRLKPSRGRGLHKKMIIGSGYTESPIEVRLRKNAVMKKVINGKYINMNKLKDNILMIRYCSTNALIPTIKVQRITDDTKGVINDIIEDKFEKRLFEKLSEDEKRIVKRFVQVFNLDLDVTDKIDEEYKKQFEIVLGQFQSGNNNPAIKTKLKQYITESMESGFLPRRQCFKLLFELANA